MDHTIGKCEKFKKLLQRMMDQGETEFFERIMEESVNMIIDARFIGESFSGGSRPLTIFFEYDSVSMANVTMHPSKLTVEVSSPFPYTDNKIVLWNYN